MGITRDQILDELEYLAALEHALVVDHLQIYYALGTDENLGAPGGEPSPQGTEAANASFLMAISDMRHFGSVVGVLVRAGRRPAFERARHVLPPAGPAIPLGSLTPAQFHAFTERQEAIASTVDARYASFESVLTSASPPLDSDLMGEIGVLLVSGTDHLAQVPGLVDPLAGMEPSAYLRATRVEPADDLERSLLAVSNRYYRTLLAILGARFTHQELAGDLFGRAQTAMTELDGCNKLLVARGVIPRFSLATAD
ncbi:MAG: hypothetical protein ACR2HV_00400 [Acidimicrobiales bacterium]